MGFFFGRFKRWSPAPDEFEAHVEAPSLAPVRLDRFSRGIDNAHIDIRLSESFVNGSKMLIQRLLRHEVGKRHWREAVSAPDRREIDRFLDTYTTMFEMALGRARKLSRPEFLQLFQFAVWKFLLQQVGVEVDRLRAELQGNLGDNYQTLTRDLLPNHIRRVLLTKDRFALTYRVNQFLFRHLQKAEVTELARLRRSIIGMSWPVAKDVLFNPLLQLPSLEADEQFMDNYPLLLTESEPLDCFRRCNEMIVELFADYLPDWAKPETDHGPLGSGEDAGTSGFAVRQRFDQGGLPGFLEVERLLLAALGSRESREQRLSWLDNPDNLERLLHTARPLDSYRDRDEEGDPSTLWRQHEWPEFQRQQADALHRRMVALGLVRPVLAAYATPRIYRELSGKVPARDINRYVGGTMSTARLRQRLRGFQLGDERAALIKVLKVEARRIQRMGRQEQRENLMHFLRDFACFRRDLKLAFLAHEAMDGLRLLFDPEEIQLSRTNGSLQELVTPPELVAGRQPIRNHVVVKADVRGSTEITTRLLERNLNPASYFSLNFFGPINQLVEDFGATKTFIEGDAIILTIFEYEDVAFGSLSVAHACGLARKILDVIDIQNAKNRKHGLPELELGIGIAFSDGPPTYLYDGESQIMISPAINRADRLSSCSSVLRRSPLQKLRRRGVELVASVDESRFAEPDAEGLLRYNVNGIELEAPAYFKLKLELAMQRVEIEADGADDPQIFYAGRYPDCKGKMHWLVIRDAPIRIWIGNDFSTLEPRGRHFFEVVTDRDLMAKVRDRLPVEADHTVSATGVRMPDAKPRDPGWLH